MYFAKRLCCAANEASADSPSSEAPNRISCNAAASGGEYVMIAEGGFSILDGIEELDIIQKYDQE